MGPGVALELFSDILTHSCTKYVEGYHVHTHRLLHPQTTTGEERFSCTHTYATGFLASSLPPLQILWGCFDSRIF